MKMIAGGAAVPAPKFQPERARAERVDGPIATAEQHEEEPHVGPRLSSLRQIIAELEAQRAIDLKYDIERYVRPAEVDFGHFRYTAAPKTPNDLSFRIKSWLEETTGVEWEVLQSDDGAGESTSETRTRRRTERIKAAEAHPRIAEALKVFPGARVLKVEELESSEELDDAPAKANVIHVDFSARERPDADIPDPEEREDDD